MSEDRQHEQSPLSPATAEEEQPLQVDIIPALLATLPTAGCRFVAWHQRAVVDWAGILRAADGSGV